MSLFTRSTRQSSLTKQHTCRVTPRDFLLGFAIIQALPGPMFNFAGFLGVLVVTESRFAGGILGIVAIFLPVRPRPRESESFPPN